MPQPTASGRISRERFRQGSRNVTRLLGIIGYINMPEMASLGASGWLQNVINNCTKVRNTGAADSDRQRVE